ncbi:MAG: LuxR C-terminal-related transcriptional regulator, partial [Nocardioidaceae bacterium]
ARALVALAPLVPAPEAEQLLRAALELAECCAADRLRAEVAAMLAGLGIDVPAEPSAGTALTAAERRIGAMAADGATHAEIAQALFVTTSTVSVVVESVAARLGAQTLDELRAALAHG